MPEIELIRVGDRTPPPGFVADLTAFDPDLCIKWSNQDQRWVVFQKVRRNRHCGAWEGQNIYEIKDYDAPVLWIDGMKEPDRRVIEQLFSKRARDRAERLDRLRRKGEAMKKAKDAELSKKFAGSREGSERGAYELRKRGVAGTMAPFYASSGGCSISKE